MRILKPLIFPGGDVQPRRSENRPSSMTRKFDTWGKGAERESPVDAQERLHMWKSATPTRLYGDSCGVSDETGVDGINGQGIFRVWTQVCHQRCAHVCL